MSTTPVSNAPPKTRPYKPSALDYRYLAALREVLTDPGHAPRTKLAQLMGVERHTTWRMEADPRRMAWVREQLGGEMRDNQWEQLVTRAFYLAMKGSVEWARFFAQATLKFTDSKGTPDALGGGTGTVVWVNHIPRPDPAQMLAPVVGATTGQVHGSPPVIVDVLDLTR